MRAWIALVLLLFGGAAYAGESCDSAACTEWRARMCLGRPASCVARQEQRCARLGAWKACRSKPQRVAACDNTCQDRYEASCGSRRLWGCVRPIRSRCFARGIETAGCTGVIATTTTTVTSTTVRGTTTTTLRSVTTRVYRSGSGDVTIYLDGFGNFWIDVVPIDVPFYVPCGMDLVGGAGQASLSLSPDCGDRYVPTFYGYWQPADLGVPISGKLTLYWRDSIPIVLP